MEENSIVYNQAILYWKNLRLLHRFINDTCIVHRDIDYLQKSIELSIKLGVTVYDLILLALAERYETRVSTIDKKLVETLKCRGEEHRVLSSWNTNR